MIDLAVRPTRADVGLEDGSIAEIVDDRDGRLIDVAVRADDGEVTLEAVSVAYESERSTSDPARAVIKLEGVPLGELAESVARLAPLNPSIDLAAEVDAFVAAQPSSDMPDGVSNAVIPLVVADGGRGIDVNLRYRASSGTAVPTVYLSWD